MVLELCDDSLRQLLFTRFSAVVPEIADEYKDVIFCPEDLALRQHAEGNANDQLDFISFWRPGPEFSWDRNRTSVSRRGLDVKIGPDVKNTKVIPVDLGYNVIFWTKSLMKLNAFVKEYLFWIQENPNLNVNMLTGTDDAEFDMHYDPVSIWTSDWFNEGRYHKGKTQLKVDAWLAKETAVDPKLIEKIIFRLYVGDYNETSPHDQDATLQSETEIT